MTLIALTSAKGAPGVTTTALALALEWPRPCLLLEADPAGSSSILAGWLRGEQRHERGLIDLVDHHRHGDLAGGLHRASFDLIGSSARCLPGLTSPAQIGPVSQLWPHIAHALRGLEGTGVDVLVDAGRAGTVGFAAPILDAADLNLLVSRADLPAIAAARGRAQLLKEQLAGAAAEADSLGLVLIGPGRPYVAREISPRVGVPTIGEIPWLPSGAEHFSLGAKPEARGRRRESAAMRREARGLATALQALAQHRRTRLDPGRLVNPTT